MVEKEISRPPPQGPTAAILYSNPLNSPCTLTGFCLGAAEVVENFSCRDRYNKQTKIFALEKPLYNIYREKKYDLDAEGLEMIKFLNISESRLYFCLKL